MKNIIAYRRLTLNSQKDFATLLGISVTSYASKEKGKTQFKALEMKKITDEIKKKIPNVTIEEIFFEDKLQKLQKEVTQCN